MSSEESKGQQKADDEPEPTRATADAAFSTRASHATTFGGNSSGSKRGRLRSESKSESVEAKQRRYDDGKPKRPLSAYNLYFQEERKKLLDSHAKGEAQMDFVVPEGREHSEALFQAVSRTVANRWKAMSDEQKTPYYERAKVEMGKYRKHMAEYKQKNH